MAASAQHPARSRGCALLHRADIGAGGACYHAASQAATHVHPLVVLRLALDDPQHQPTKEDGEAHHPLEKDAVARLVLLGHQKVRSKAEYRDACWMGKRRWRAGPRRVAAVMAPQAAAVSEEVSAKQYVRASPPRRCSNKTRMSLQRFPASAYPRTELYQAQPCVVVRHGCGFTSSSPSAANPVPMCVPLYNQCAVVKNIPAHARPIAKSLILQ